MIRKVVSWAAACAVASVAVGTATAQDAATYFKQNCVSCHTIGGGRLTGPDLKDVTKREQRDWLTKFITNPQAMMDAGDARALALRDEARGVVMPPPPGATPALIDALLDLIEAESALEASQFKGMQLSNAPFTAADATRGERFFLGTRPLKNGGPACVSCHATGGVGGLGGGGLGPDLRREYEVLQGRVGMGSWLAAPATPTMRAVFQDHPLDASEIHALTAYFEKQARDGATGDSSQRLNFALLGLGGAVFGLAVMNFVWKDRLRGVRRPLVHGQTSRG